MDDTWPLPRIDLSRCNGCGRCVALCPARAVELSAGRAVIVRPRDCTFCDLCETYCPEGAIGRLFRIIFAPAGGPITG
jgi:NAD-dependent dihydropyrimidine dehydrogenase PreA subunit